MTAPGVWTFEARVKQGSFVLRLTFRGPDSLFVNVQTPAGGHRPPLQLRLQPGGDQIVQMDHTEDPLIRAEYGEYGGRLTSRPHYFECIYCTAGAVDNLR